MDFEDHSFNMNNIPSSSSSCSSSFNDDVLSRPASPSASSAAAPSPQPAQKKRKAGRKKFRETRHPVYRGVRERNGGKWVCEVREPHKNTRIWLGTYLDPDLAARAHDVAAIALRGTAAQLNFPDSARILPRARSVAAADIRSAAAQATRLLKLLACSVSSSSSSPPLMTSVKKNKNYKKKNKTLILKPETCTSPPAAAVPESPPENEGAAAAAAFVDEEALFNMPALLHSMAEGLLLTPPTMQRGGGFDWDDDVDYHMDFNLWDL